MVQGHVRQEPMNNLNVWGRNISGNFSLNDTGFNGWVVLPKPPSHFWAYLVLATSVMTSSPMHIRTWGHIFSQLCHVNLSNMTQAWVHILTWVYLLFSSSAFLKASLPYTSLLICSLLHLLFCASHHFASLSSSVLSSPPLLPSLIHSFFPPSLPSVLPSSFPNHHN